MTLKESNGKRSTFVIQKVGMYHVFELCWIWRLCLGIYPNNSPPLSPTWGTSHPFWKPHLLSTSKPLSSSNFVSKKRILGLWSWASFDIVELQRVCPVLYSSSSRSLWLLGKLLQASFLKPIFKFSSHKKSWGACLNILNFWGVCLNSLNIVFFILITALLKMPTT